MSSWRAALAALGMAALGMATTAASAQDARGEAAFRACRSCHSLDPARTGMAGPHLAGLKDRILGSAGGFDYSPAFEAAKARGLVWSGTRRGWPSISPTPTRSSKAAG